MEPQPESCLGFRIKLRAWLTKIVACFPAHETENGSPGCWLRGLECAIDAWLASNSKLRICQLGKLGNLLWQFFKMWRLSPRRDCFYILTTRTSDRVPSDKESALRQKSRTQRRIDGIFARPSYTNNIPFGHSFQNSGLRKYELQIFVWKARNTDLLDATKIPRSSYQKELRSGYLEVKHCFSLEVSQYRIIERRAFFEFSKLILRGGREGEPCKQTSTALPQTLG